MTEQDTQHFTSRGFRIYADFIDRYGHRVRVQESSIATEHCVWISCDDGKDAHLTVDDARAVRDALNDFLTEPDWAADERDEPLVWRDVDSGD